MCSYRNKLLIPLIFSDDLDDEDDEDQDILEHVTEIPSSSIGAYAGDNGDVIICDTQVILRINPNAEQDEKDHIVTQSKKLSSNNKRMTRRLLNADEAFKITPADQVQVQKLQAGAKLSGVHNLPPKLPKRKDLCRLLGLNEQDVDLMIVPEVKVAQKVALSHSVVTESVAFMGAQNSSAGAAACSAHKNTAKKKDLAKFLGVTDDPTPVRKPSATPSANGSEPVCPSAPASEGGQAGGQSHHRRKDQSPRPKSFLINWGQMVKSSVKGWKFDENNDECEMDVPVQLRQIPSKEPDRTHRKDLSKFLGFADDSDSEEIVFFRNANPSINDSSLTRKSSSFDDTDMNDGQDSDDSAGSLRSFDSFVRRSLRCGASSEFAIQIEEGVHNQHLISGASVHMGPSRASVGPRRGESAPMLAPLEQQQVQQKPQSSVCKSHSSYQQSAVARRRRKKDAEKRSQEIHTGDHFSQHVDTESINSAAMAATTANSLVTLDRKNPATITTTASATNINQTSTSRILPRTSKEKQRVVFGPNSRRMISPVRTKKTRQQQHHNDNMPPVFMREEPLFVYPQKPALFYQHYPLYTSYGILPPGGRINPNNGRVRFPRQQAKRPQMNG